MADWIDCELTVLGDNLSNFENNAKGNIQRYLGDEACWELLSFHKLYPVPRKYTDTYYDESSYDWEVRHWGCKHGAKHSKIAKRTDDSLVYVFLASNVPINWLKKVSLDYPDLVFDLECEIDLDFSKYRIVVENGIAFTF